MASLHPTAPPAPLVIGITGCTRGGKSWTAKALRNAFTASLGANGSVAVVGQDSFWRRPVRITCANGKVRSSEEEPECTDHAAFAAAIQTARQSRRVVIAEGFQLLHAPEVAAQISHVFVLEIARDEAKRRRTVDRVHNPNPMSTSDFDDLVWPAHERYYAQSVRPCVDTGEAMVLRSPSNDKDVAEIVRQVMEVVSAP